MVEDDGDGFDAKQKSMVWLNSMRERVEGLGGEFEV